MGRGSSKVGAGGGGGAMQLFTNAAFDEDNEIWDEFEKSFGPKISAEDRQKLKGYVATWKAFDLNKKFWDNKTSTLTASEKETVATLDKTIASHTTPKDAVFTRYVDSGAVQNILGLSDSQLKTLKSIHTMDSSQIDMLNQALKGTQSLSLSYSSTSAVSKHLFSSKHFRREISVPKGTHAFATNPHEHEVIFGRGMKTVLDHVSLDGKQIVLHERFIGYDS